MQMMREHAHLRWTLAITLGLFACTHIRAPESSPLPPASQPEVFNQAALRDIDLDRLPVLPEITPAMREQLRAAYAVGKMKGRNPRVLTKMGDCMTDNPHFLAPLGDGSYVLGEHSSIERVIARFRGTPARRGSWEKDSFLTPSLAAGGGFNVASPLDPTWADPTWCQPEESPLTCELRVANPAFAIIMFGTNDVNTTPAASFDLYLRDVVSQALAAGVIPILSTFPPRPENPDKSKLLNQIVASIAHDYQVPLVNFARALQDLPNHGVDPQDSTHLTLPPHGHADIFTPESLRYGFNLRNLLTLQALDRVIAAVEEDEG